MAVAAGWGGVGAREGPRRALRAPFRADAFCPVWLVCAALHACVRAWKAPRSALEVPIRYDTIRLGHLEPSESSKPEQRDTENVQVPERVLCARGQGAQRLGGEARARG